MKRRATISWVRKRGVRRTLRAALRDAGGATAVEFAMIAPAFFAMIIGVCDVMLAVSAQNTLENAVFIGARTVKTGYVGSASDQQRTVAAAIREASPAMLNPAKIAVTSLAYADYSDVGQPEPFTDANKNGKRDPGEPFTDVNGNGSYDADRGKSGYGGSGQIVVFTATYPWTFITPFVGDLVGTNGVLTLKAKAVVKNEPY